MAATEETGHSKSRSSNNIESRQNPEGTESRPNASEEDDSSHYPKRRRVAKACNQCRQAKLKCDGQLPHCGTCLKGKKACLYGQTMRRRGLRTGYVRVLECLWGLVFQSIEGSETAVELLISHTSKRGFWLGDEIRDGPKSGEAPLERWKSSKVPRVIDALLSASEDAMDEEEVAAVLDLPQTKDMDLNWFLGVQPFSNPTIRPNNSSTDLLYPTDIQDPISKPSCGTAGLTRSVDMAQTTSTARRHEPPELPHNAQRLLDRYFALTQSWLPIVERHSVYKSLFAYRRRGTAEDDNSWMTGENGVLWAIFAYSTATNETSRKIRNLRSATPEDEYYMTARSIIPIEREDNYSLGHVQTLLVLGLLHYSACQWSVARLTIGQAILIAGHIGLDQLETSHTDHHKRAWLGCFVLDTLTSANAGKVPRIQPAQVRAFITLGDAGNEEWEPWRLQEALLPGVGTEKAEIESPTHTITVFNTLLHLLCIVNDWMCSVADSPNENFKLLLETWWDSLPEHIRTIIAADNYTVNVASTGLSSQPGNILNLSIIHAFLRTALSRSAPPLMEFNFGQVWQPLVHATEDLLRRFDEQALPPSFHMIRTLLIEDRVRDCPISELVIMLKKQAYGHESLHQSQANLGCENMNQNKDSTDVFSNSHDPSTASIDNTLLNLAPRIEENFASFMDMPGPWPNIPAELLLDLQNVPDLSGSQEEQSTIVAGGSVEMHSQGTIPEEAALGNFSDWDDTETHDRELFRKNLGFSI